MRIPEVLEEDLPTVLLRTPVSMLDIDRAEYSVNMDLPMSDPCPSCGGFCMASGDYVCWGVCHHCAREAKP